MASLSLSGCMSSPTYGTDKTAGEQLLSDLGDATSLTDGKRRDLKYAPRPGLVLPAAGEKESLVEPQQSVASKDNPSWVESPEEVRARLRDEAEEKKNNPTFRSPLAQASTNGRKLQTDQQLQAYREARKEQKGAYDERRFLSDPPTQYRAVSDPAALTDLGEPESKKEKRRKKEATMANKSRNWWSPFQ